MPPSEGDFEVLAHSLGFLQPQAQSPHAVPSLETSALQFAGSVEYVVDSVGLGVSPQSIREEMGSAISDESPLNASATVVYDAMRTSKDDNEISSAGRIPALREGTIRISSDMISDTVDIGTDPRHFAWLGRNLVKDTRFECDVEQLVQAHSRVFDPLLQEDQRPLGCVRLRAMPMLK